MEAKEKVTIKDIAKLAGVSVGSVDRALHGRYGIKETTRQHILDTIEQSGYVVNELASLLSRNQVFRIAFLAASSYYDDFYKDVHYGALEAANQLKDYGIEFITHLSEDIDMAGEKVLLEKLALENVHGIVLCPFHESELDSLINRFVDTGVPVVTVATDAPQSKRLACVSTDSYQNGRTAAELMASLLSDRGGKVIAISGFKCITDHERKMQGFCDYMAGNVPDVALVGAFHTNHTDSEAYNITCSMLTMHPDLKGIYVATSCSRGVCTAVEERGFSGKLVFITTDLHKGVRHYIRKGTISATIFQSPFQQGYMSAKILFDYLSKGKSVQGTNFVRPEIVLPNMVSLF